MHTTTLPAMATDYAVRLIQKSEARHSSSQPAAQNPPPAEDWITTTEAADISGYSQRRIQALCDEGFFVAGADWKQRPAMDGKRSAGRIFIRRSALKKLEGE